MGTLGCQEPTYRVQPRVQATLRTALISLRDQKRWRGVKNAFRQHEVRIVAAGRVVAPQGVLLASTGTPWLRIAMCGDAWKRRPGDD